MRGFFVLLLLTNVGVFAWQYWLSLEESAPKPSLYQGIALNREGLKLISEQQQEQLPAQRSTIAIESKEEATSVAEVGQSDEQSSSVDDSDQLEVEGISTGSTCYVSNLLTGLAEAKGLQTSLSKLGIKESHRRTVETKKVNYWVMLNPYASRAKAKEAAEILKRNRIKDIFIVRSGSHENAVSLGVFSTRMRAEERYREIRSLKARLRKPVIEALELPAKRLVVELSLPDGSEPDEFAALLDSSRQPHLKKIRCK